MFAVKGWNVDASQLKAQTSLFKSSNDDNLINGGGKGEKSARKRKRERSEQDISDEQASTLPKQSKKHKKQQESTKEDPADAASEHDDRPQSSKQDGAKAVKKEKKKKDKTKPKKSTEQSQSAVGETHADQAVVTKTPAALKLTPMQAAMRQKLVSARFRHLNETLYTAPSQQAQELFNSNPDMFEDYHAGFRQQVSVWPENPVDKMIQKIRQRGKVRLPSQKKAFSSNKHSKDEEDKSTSPSLPPLPRTSGTCVIADCGCGDARLAQTLKSANDLQKLNVKVLSYDLHSPSALITKADISNLPLADGSVDVVIFCLALMGTNWISFIEEAFRVLHWKGELWIAEIKSRFARPGKKGRVVEHSVGNRQKCAAIAKAQETKRQEQEEAAQEDALATEVDGVEKNVQETDVQSFVDVLKRRGFVLKDDQASIDLSNKMFVSMEFSKAVAPAKGKHFKETNAPGPKKPKFVSKAVAEEILTDDEGKTLKPCLYKIR